MPYLRQAARILERFWFMQNLFQEFCAPGFNPGSYKIELVKNTEQTRNSSASVPGISSESVQCVRGANNDLRSYFRHALSDKKCQ